MNKTIDELLSLVLSVIFILDLMAACLFIIIDWRISLLMFVILVLCIMVIAEMRK